LTVEAKAFTAGPYGEAWTLRIPAAGEEAFLEIGYMLSPMGDMKGSFFLDRSKVAGLRGTIDSERFMDLPERIEPSSALPHQPTLILEIRLGDRTHRVFLYDPDQFQGDWRSNASSPSGMLPSLLYL
jgi:hypothetical protein